CLDEEIYPVRLINTVIIQPHTEQLTEITVPVRQRDTMIFSHDHQLQQLRWIMTPNAVVKIDDYHSIISITNPTDNPKMIFRNTVIGVICTPPVESECIPIMALIQDKNNVLQQTNTDPDNMCGTCKTQFQSRNLLMAHLKDMDHGTKSELTPIQELIFNKINHLDEQQQLQARFTSNKYQKFSSTSCIKYHERSTTRRSEQDDIILLLILKDGIIRPSNSPWSSPVVTVKKKDGSPRFCVDYRKINLITQKDVYPLPRMDDIMEQMAGSKWYSKLDMKSGYFQVPISESDKKKTAFSTQDGLFEFNGLPQGLMNSPPTYQRIMNDTLGHLRWDCCLVYLDDVIVFSPTFEQHLEDVSKVCRVLSNANFKLNVDKCEFFKQQIEYLGHKIHERGIQPSDGHVQAIKNFPTPTTAKSAYAFLQTATFFRRFIKNFAGISPSLKKFGLKDAQKNFIWSEQEQNAFDQLKQCLWTVEGYKPVAYVSRTLTTTERKYPISEKECLAIWWCVSEKFRSHLYGQSFVVETDHQNLTSISTKPYKNARIDRWAMKLQDFDFKIKHINGNKNVVADFLSRYPSGCIMDEQDKINDVIKTTTIQQPMIAAVTTRTMQKQNIKSCDDDDQKKNINDGMKHQQSTTPQQQRKVLSFDDTTLKEHQQNDPVIQDIITNINDRERRFMVKRDGLLYWRITRRSGRRYQLRYVPQSLRMSIILAYHDSTDSGSHYGVQRTYDKLKNYYHWPKQYKDVEAHVKKSPSGPWEKVSMDFIGKIPTSSQGNQYILVLTDIFSKYVVTKAVKNCTTSTVVQFLKNDVIFQHGAPKEIVTDNGSHFRSTLMEEITKLLGCKHITVSPYHPEANGQCKRFNATLFPKILALMNEKRNNWDDKLKPVTFNYNNSIHATTKYAPEEIRHGSRCRLPADPHDTPIKTLLSKEWNEEIKKCLDDIHLATVKNIQKVQNQMKTRFDRHRRDQEYQVGDLVVVKNEHPENKLSPKYIGPYEIIRRLGHKTYEVRFNQHGPIHRLTVDKMHALN
ncbi:unnamed protein product, partial [Didymodactylos carnosus]